MSEQNPAKELLDAAKASHRSVKPLLRIAAMAIDAIDVSYWPFVGHDDVAAAVTQLQEALKELTRIVGRLEHLG